MGWSDLFAATSGVPVQYIRHATRSGAPPRNFMRAAGHIAAAIGSLPSA